MRDGKGRDEGCDMLISQCPREIRTGSCSSTKPAPSVLAVTSELPWPLNTGGHLRTFHLLRSLAARFRVRLVIAGSPGLEEGIEVLREHGVEVTPATVAPRTTAREVLRAATAAARGEPYVLYRRHDRRGVRLAIQRQMHRERPDLLYLDHLDSLLYRNAAHDVPTIVDLHNIYSELVRRSALEQPSTAKRRYLLRESRLLIGSERRAGQLANALFTVSEGDNAYFRSLGARSTYVVPNGVDCKSYAGLPAGRHSSTPKLLYLGCLSWGPNAAAADYLAKQILPRVREAIPCVELLIVGRDPTEAVRALEQLPGVVVAGNVPDVRPYLQKASALAVPLEAGGGTRLKILEAFSAGLPVVSTPVGCEGLDASPGEHLIVADRTHFAEAIVGLLKNPLTGERLAARARYFVNQRFDWEAIGDSACTAVEAVIRAKTERAMRG